MRGFVVLPTLVITCPVATTAMQSPGTAELISVDHAGVGGDLFSFSPALSADGRLVAFYSSASNIVPGDTNGSGDVFLRDLRAGTTILVSVNDQGQQGDNESFPPAIGGRGRFVVFPSFATNLVPNDNNNLADAFCRDLLLQSTSRISVSSVGSEANGGAFRPSISGDGRYVVFVSDATNLVQGDTNARIDIFLRDQLLGSTELLSVSTLGVQGNHDCDYPTISDDGRYCAFESRATNLDPSHPPQAVGNIFLRDRQLGTTVMLALSPSGQAPNSFVEKPLVSGDGAHVGFSTYATNIVPGDTNTVQDSFVYGIISGITERVSVGPGGTQVDQGCRLYGISRDGRFLTMQSKATTLISGGSNSFNQVYMHDRLSGVNRLMSQSLTGQHGVDDSGIARVSDDGRWVAFESAASNLHPGDVNVWDDIFLSDTTGGTTFTYCMGKLNSQGCAPRISTVGFPSAVATSGFVLHCENVRNQTIGFVLYSFFGPAVTPFQGGYLCVQPPVRRMVVTNSGGSPIGVFDCTGRWSTDVSSFASGQLGGSPDPGLRQPGTRVDAQWWGRDQGFPPPFNSALSEGLEFIVLP